MFFFGSLLLISLHTLASCSTEPQQGANPHFAPYLKPGELPDGAVMPLFHEIWTVIGGGLTNPNFTAQVNLVAPSIFSQYSYHGLATSTAVAIGAPTYLDGKLGMLASSVIVLKGSMAQSAVRDARQSPYTVPCHTKHVTSLLSA